MEGCACPIGGGEFHFVEQGRKAADKIEVEWPGEDQPSDVYFLDSSHSYRKKPRDVSELNSHSSFWLGVHGP
jgi:hypothetical protein